MDFTLHAAVAALVHRARKQWRWHLFGCPAYQQFRLVMPGTAANNPINFKDGHEHGAYAKKLLMLARNLKEAALHLESTE